MKCTDLARRVERLRPEADARDIARVCLLLCNSSPKIDNLSEEAVLESALEETDLRLLMATDQHAATTEDLECLACSWSEPQRSKDEQTRILLRAISVQCQILQMYLG